MKTGLPKVSALALLALACVGTPAPVVPLRDLTPAELSVLIVRNNSEDNKLLRKHGRVLKVAYFSSQRNARISAAACAGNVVEVHTTANHEETQAHYTYSGTYSVYDPPKITWSTTMAIIYELAEEHHSELRIVDSEEPSP